MNWTKNAYEEMKGKERVFTITNQEMKMPLVALTMMNDVWKERQVCGWSQ